MNTLKINVPEGFEIDKDKSTFEEIVFKPIKKELPKTWGGLTETEGWYVNGACEIKYVTGTSCEINAHRNIFVTEAQANAAIALAQLSQLREVYRQGWVPSFPNHVIVQEKGEIVAVRHDYRNVFLSFQSREIRDEFLKNFKDLIEEASPLLFG
jgi:hypothetical protein